MATTAHKLKPFSVSGDISQKKVAVLWQKLKYIVPMLQTTTCFLNGKVKKHTFLG